MRLLINTRDFNQRGQIVNIPGKLVDILTDQARSRLYILRQDQNVVLVYDAATLQRIAFLRTGNTPTQMAFSADQKYLLIGNDNSQIANVFDLDILQDAGPIVFPGGHYPRSFGVARSGIFARGEVGPGPPPTPEARTVPLPGSRLTSHGVPCPSTTQGRPATFHVCHDETRRGPRIP